MAVVDEGDSGAGAEREKIVNRRKIVRMSDAKDDALRCAKGQTLAISP